MISTNRLRYNKWLIRAALEIRSMKNPLIAGWMKKVSATFGTVFLHPIMVLSHLPHPMTTQINRPIRAQNPQFNCPFRTQTNQPIRTQNPPINYFKTFDGALVEIILLVWIPVVKAFLSYRYVNFVHLGLLYIFVFI